MASELQNELPLDIQALEVSHLNGFTATASCGNEDSSENALFTTSMESGECEIDVFKKSEIPTLIQLFTEVYHQRIADIEKNDSLDINKKNEEKLMILQSYLEQLKDQNNVLISTLIELEAEVQHRVQQMEKRLKSTAKTTMEAVINVHECEKEMTRIIEERLCIESLFTNMEQHLSSVKSENSYLRDQNFNLSHDVQALLHVIHHARSTGHWEMDCVTFCEVTPEQVFGPVQSISSMYTTDSPPFEFHGIAKKNSDSPSQVSNSNPDISHSCGSHKIKNIDFNAGRHDHQMETLVKEKKNVHLSEMQHQLVLKETQCQCHLWKCDNPIMKKNSPKHDDTPVSPMSRSTSPQRCFSLPLIGNIYSCADVLRKSHTCQITHSTQKSVIVDSESDVQQRININEKTFRTNKQNEAKNFSNSAVCRTQSEPHLFMYGDDIYVYKPCEHIKKASNIALRDEFQLNLPHCQSIDLKFPSEDSNLKIYDWDFLSNNARCSVPDNIYGKIRESSSSCMSSCSDGGTKSRELVSNSSNPVSLDPRIHLLDISKRKNCEHNNCFSPSKTLKEKCNFIPKNISMSSACVQTENHKYSLSIGLQTDINVDNIKIQDMNENALLGMDFLQIKKTMHVLKDSALKAEDKAEAKGILIEQLQNHLDSIAHEMDLKDQAFINLEKKLDNSRGECATLRNEISTLNSEMQHMFKDFQDAQMLNDNLMLKVNMKEEKIQDLLKEQKILHEQKRALMTQLDVQGDELENAKKELIIANTKLQNRSLQLEQQSKIIRNLQEALVQSKRAFDAAYPKMSGVSGNSSSSNLPHDSRASSKSSIIDI